MSSRVAAVPTGPRRLLSIGRGLLGVSIVAAIICGVALYALVRVISVSDAYRVERGRAFVTAELDRMQKSPTASPIFTMVGMRGGVLPSGASAADVKPALDDVWEPSLARALAESHPGGTRALAETHTGDGTLIVGVASHADGSRAWVGYPVAEPPHFRIWRAIVVVLTSASILLVATALFVVLSVRRGATALTGSLAALTRDLATPITRPNVRELDEVAAGIAALVCELERAQREQARLGRELAERDRLAVLGRVTAGVAHEVRNPLAAMKLRIDLAMGRADVPADLSSELGQVSSEITRLDRLVADLLVVAGRRCGPRARVPLGAMARGRVDLLAPWAEGRGVKLVVRGDALAMIEEEAVARAVDNLLRNAVEASPAGAEVICEIDDDARGPRLTVIDAGAGVPQDREAELFEPFFTTKPDGTGLGLALSRSIASAQDGTIRYVRAAGRTRFELSFPQPEEVLA